MSADPQPTAGAVSGAARADDAVRETSAFQRAILECADYAIISTSPDGIIRTFNRAAERLLGYRAEEVVGRVTPDIIHDPDEVARRAAQLTAELGRPVAAGFEAFVAKARLGVADEQEWTYIRKDGSRFPVQLSVTAMHDDAGEILGFLGIAHDITRRRTAQTRVGQLTALLDRRVRQRTEQVAASEERFRLVVEASPSGLLMVDREGRIVLVNEQMERLFGYARAELIGQPVELLVPERARGAHMGLRAAFSARPAARPMGAGRNLFARRKDGSEFPVEIGLNPIELEDGPVVLGTVVDITQRQQAEARLRASEEGLKLAQHAARVGTFEWNVLTGVNTWSPELEALHGLPPGGFPGTQPAWEKLVHPDDLASAKALVQRAFDTNVPVEGEWRVVWPDGSTHWLIGRFQVFCDAAGRSLRLTGVNLDITARKRAEQLTVVLAELGRRLSAADTRRAAAGAVLAAADQLLNFDAMLLHLLSPDRQRVFRVLTVDTFQGRRTELPGDYEAREPSLMFRRVLRQGAQLVLRQELGDSTIPFEPFGDSGRQSASLMFVPMRAGANTVGVLSLQSYAPRAYSPADLELLQTLADHAAGAFERLETEDTLRDSEQRFRSTFEQAAVGVSHVGLDGRWLRVNDWLCNLIGYTREELMTKTFQDITHPEDLAPDLAQARRLLAGEIPHYGMDKRYIHKDGSLVWIRLNGSLVRTADGTPQYFIAIVQDIRTRKAAEDSLRQARTELEARVQERTAELARLNMLLHTEVEERKAMEAELRSREEQLRDLFENATDLIQSVAPDGRILFVNRAWLNTLGYRMSELAALTIFDIIHPDCFAECREQFTRVMQGEALTDIHAVFRAKDGRVVHVEGNASCRFEDGRPIATRAIFRDITKRKAIEAERERLIQELQAALAEVKTLSGLLPVCGWCKKIRDDSGYWNSVESYLKKSSGLDITHGICPECSAKMMVELEKVSDSSPAAPPAP